MEDYEMMVRECYSPIINQYKLQFEKLDGGEFFLIGNGFALYIFIDRRDMRADVWFVSLDKNGTIKTHSLMDVMENRFDENDSSCYGNPKSPDEQVKGYVRFDVSGLLRHCQDILSGDPQWVNQIITEGRYSRHVANFLAPYFRAQGYSVIISDQI